MRARRDPRHRRRAGQRPDRADRGHPRPAAAGERLHRARRHELRAARACARILDAGVGFVPEDRNDDGLVGEFTIAENLMLDRSNGAPFVAARQPPARRRSPSSPSEKVDEFDVRTQGIGTPVGHALRRQPAEGRARARTVATCGGCSSPPSPPAASTSARSSSCTSGSSRPATPACRSIVVSTELDEVAALADRIAVMYRGRDRRHRARRHPARRAGPDDGRRDAIAEQPRCAA